MRPDHDDWLDVIARLPLAGSVIAGVLGVIVIAAIQVVVIMFSGASTPAS